MEIKERKKQESEGEHGGEEEEVGTFVMCSSNFSTYRGAFH